MFANHHHQTLPRSGLKPAILLALITLLLSASLSAADLKLSWNASVAENLGGYKLYYGTSSQNYTASVDVGNTTSYVLQSLQPGATYYFAVSAYDLTKTVDSGYSEEISATVTTLTADFSASQTSGNAALTVSFAPTVSGNVNGWQWNFGDGTINAGTTSTVPTAIKTYKSEGTYTVSLTVTGADGSATKTKSDFIVVTAAPTGDDSSTGGGSTGGSGSTGTVNTGGASGLVAAYGFDENNGIYAIDTSGLGNLGQISGANRIATGRFGNALKFNGTNNVVTIGNSASLSLTTGMTLEAWVYPTNAEMNGLRTVIMKEKPATSTTAAGESYLLAANNTTNQPMSAVFASNEVAVGGTMQIPPNQWTHLASTYDGQYQYLYINGVLVNMLPQTGPIATSTGSLKIGGNCIWGGYFQGYIDEVRIYNRALTQSEVIKDAETAVSLSNPLKFIAGNQNVESATVTLPEGVAQAFKFTMSSTGRNMSNLQVYLDAGTTAQNVVVGLYTNTADGHPGSLYRFASIAAKPGEWNSLSAIPLYLMPGKSYWLAVVGTGGALQLRGNTEGSGVAEFSASNTLTALPSSWSVGTTISSTPVSFFSAGY